MPKKKKVPLEQDVEFEGDESDNEGTSQMPLKKRRKPKKGGDLLDAEVDDLMEEIISLKEQLAEERAERVNLEGTLAKSRKKLMKARDQRGESEQSVQQNFVESKRRIKELESQVTSLETGNAQLKTDLAQWSTEATSLREQMTATTGAGKKVIETVMDENRALKKKVGQLEEELRHTKIDLKFASMTGSKWRGEETSGLGGTNPNRDDTIGMADTFMGGGNTISMIPERNNQMGQDPGMFATTSYIPIKSTEELLQNNRYVQVAKVRKDLSEAIVDKDQERLEQAIDVAIEHNLQVEGKAGKTVLQLLLDFDQSSGNMRKTEEELAELKHEVQRLQHIEEEAKSLRNATTAMGMALESEQEARSEVERELEIEKRERHMTEEELDGHKKNIADKQSANEQKLNAQVEQLRRDITTETKRRQRAETELYRSAVAITDHRQLMQKVADAEKLVSDLQRECGIKDDKNRQLERTVYKSSQIMFEQIEKKVEVERRARMEAENMLEKERSERKKIENERLRLVRDLETVRQADIATERDTRKHLESVVYKSSASMYKQLEERMKEEARLKSELQILTDRLVVAERERNAERLARQNLEAVATRSSMELMKGKETLSLAEQKSMQEIMTRSELMAKREEHFHATEMKNRMQLERERKLRQQAEDGHARVLREAELLRSKLKASMSAIRDTTTNSSLNPINGLDKLSMERQLNAVETEARSAAEENMALRDRVNQLLGDQEKLKEALEHATNVAEAKHEEVEALKLRLYQRNGANASSFAKNAEDVRMDMKNWKNKVSRPSNVMGDDFFGETNLEHAFSSHGGWREKEFDAMISSVQADVKRTVDKHINSSKKKFHTPVSFPPVSKTTTFGNSTCSSSKNARITPRDGQREPPGINYRLEAAYKNLEVTRAKHGKNKQRE